MASESIFGVVDFLGMTETIPHTAMQRVQVLGPDYEGWMRVREMHLGWRVGLRWYRLIAVRDVFILGQEYER